MAIVDGSNGALWGIALELVALIVPCKRMLSASPGSMTGRFLTVPSFKAFHIWLELAKEKPSNPSPGGGLYLEHLLKLLTVVSE